MHQPLWPYSLVPSGFVVVTAVHDTAATTITVRSPKDFGVCSSCGTISRRVHSRYRRRVRDLPLSRRSVKLLVVARRFRCDAVLCGRQIFAERFADDDLAPWARRIARLDHIVHHLGLALGGRPAACFSQRLMLPVSKDTLLRMVRRRARVPSDRLNVIGIDDWARRRNHSYGTIVCDLERRRPVTLLPDREPATAAAWFEQHQEITVIARDRGGGYGEAASKALPHATQVADRWHLMENASRAFLDAVRKSMRQIRSAIGATTINPDLLTATERLQYEGYLRREEINPQFSPWPRTARRSSRLSFDWGTADNSCGGSSAANDMTSSARGKVRWTRIFPGSMPNGHQGAAMARSCGGVSRSRASAVRSGLSPSGPPGVGARKMLTSRTSSASRPPAPLLV
jgi:hypothetical protein